MAKQVVDPIASWFIAAEALGEFIGIRFGHIPPAAKDPEWTFLPHTDYDGIGGFAEILRRRGASVDRLPQIRHPVSPSWLCLARALPKYLSRRRRVQWGALDAGPAPATGSASPAVPLPPPAVAWHVFDETATTHVRRVCRRAGVTVNSFLLKHLTKAIRPSLQDQSSVVPWMIPINIRGKVDRGRDTAVHTSYVGVNVRSYETVRDVHQNIYAALASGEHWANWQMYLLGRYISLGMQKRLIRAELGASQWCIGGFSNLGDWDADKKITQPDCLGAWLFTPLAWRCLSIAAGCVTFQNRLSLTIQAHPSLTTTPAVPRAWVENWVKEIEIDLASMLGAIPAAGGGNGAPAGAKTVGNGFNVAARRYAEFRPDLQNL
jgi:hypothetical protein